MIKPVVWVDAATKAKALNYGYSKPWIGVMSKLGHSVKVPFDFQS